MRLDTTISRSFTAVKKFAHTAVVGSGESGARHPLSPVIVRLGLRSPRKKESRSNTRYG